MSHNVYKVAIQMAGGGSMMMPAGRRRPGNGLMETVMAPQNVIILMEMDICWPGQQPRVGIR